MLSKTEATSTDSTNPSTIPSYFNTLKTTLTTMSNKIPQVARDISTTCQILGLNAAGTTVENTGRFLTQGAALGTSLISVAESVSETLSGATTTNEAAAANSRTGTAPTFQDLSSAANPQLATEMDPLPATDPAIPMTEFEVTEVEITTSPLTPPNYQEEAMEIMTENQVTDDEMLLVMREFERIENWIAGSKRLHVYNLWPHDYELAGKSLYLTRNNTTQNQ